MSDRTNMNAEQEAFTKAALAAHGSTITRAQVLDLCASEGHKRPSWLENGPQYRVGRGTYKLPADFKLIPRTPGGRVASPKAARKATNMASNINATTKVVTSDASEQIVMPVVEDSIAPVAAPAVFDMTAETNGFTQNMVPEKDSLYVPFGEFKSIKMIVQSRMFYPIFITGNSGNGKTMGVEQASAQTGRECIRVNFTKETDEDDLIGGLRLINGETKHVKGPVIRAMERGAVLFLDELDLACPIKVMCLQSILEGGGYFIKKTGKWIKPVEGFTIVATGNTKGKGCDDGRFVGANILNEAFLERFPITVEQPYPPAAIERKILGRVFDALELEDAAFIPLLVSWANTIRKTFDDDGVDELISTRRLVHIAKALKIFGDRSTAIRLCINRFDEDTKDSFIDLYEAIDATFVKTVSTSDDDDDEDIIPVATSPAAQTATTATAAPATSANKKVPF